MTTTTSVASGVESRKPAVACRVCHGKQARWLCETPNTHSQTRMLDHFRCLDCGSVFVGNAIDHAELAVAYGSLDDASYYQQIGEENARKMRHSIDDLLALQLQHRALIDVGTGDGMFVPLLRDAGFSDICVHEIEGVNLDKVRPLVRQVYQDHDYSTLPDAAFDAVTLLDVAEHVIDPTILMRTAYRVLRPGGVLYIHTPVVTRTDRLMHLLQRLPLLGSIGRIWQCGRTSIFHLQNYTPSSLEALLRRAGFEQAEVRVVNELSWPVSRYIHVFLLKRLRLPGALAPLFAPFFYPLLRSRLLNANKAIATARKASPTAAKSTAPQ